MSSQDHRRRLDRAIVIALGGNLPFEGRPVQAVLEAALERMEAGGLTLWARSGWWRSQAWPDPADAPFLNGIVLAEGQGGPDEVLALLHAIEVQFGRRRGRDNAPRALDLDLIAHGRTVLDGPGLRLPHPRASDRAFVMRPLAEIAPDWVHPVTGKSAAVLAKGAAVGADAAPAAQ